MGTVSRGRGTKSISNSCAEQTAGITEISADITAIRRCFDKQQISYSRMMGIMMIGYQESIPLHERVRVILFELFPVNV